MSSGNTYIFSLEPNLQEPIVKAFLEQTKSKASPSIAVSTTAPSFKYVLPKKIEVNSKASIEDQIQLRLLATN